MAKIILNQACINYLHANKIFFEISGRGRLKVGDVLYFNDNTSLEPYTSFRVGNSICSMGAFSYTSSVVDLGLKIGRYCSIAWGCTFNFPYHPYHFLSTSIFTHLDDQDVIKTFLEDEGLNNLPHFKIQAIRPCSTIENDVWVGANVVINPGLTIGTGAVLAANSVITKSVDPYTIVGGNPASVIKKRFDDETIQRLLSSEWWRYKFTDFNGMSFNNPNLFLDEFEIRKPSLNVFTPDRLDFSELQKINEI